MDATSLLPARRTLQHVGNAWPTDACVGPETGTPLRKWLMGKHHSQILISSYDKGMMQDIIQYLDNEKQLIQFLDCIKKMETLYMDVLIINQIFIVWVKL